MKRRLTGATVLAIALSMAGDAGDAAKPPLRVCADPNNLPFSNRAGEGLENRLAALLAADRGERLEYTWRPQRRGFIRNTLSAFSCDVVLGVPRGFDPVLTTRPYYRSTYVFVSRSDRDLRLQSLDDPRLHQLKVGVQMIGDDMTNTPPAHALAQRGIIRNVVGFPVYGDYSQPTPLAPIVVAVERGEIDTAIVWGPIAGYLARHSPVPLSLAAVSPHVDSPALPFVFDIAMGVRRGDTARRQELDDFLTRRRRDIEAILEDYGVPRVEEDDRAGH